jgi:hypothetical protein
MWSMPRNVLKVVASGVACCAVLGFVVGLNGAGHRPRLPGETSDVSNAPPLVAADARPISPDEIAPPESADPDRDDKKDDDDKAPPAKLAEAPPAPVTPPPDVPPPAPDKVGDILDAASQPPADEPPH